MSKESFGCAVFVRHARFLVRDSAVHILASATAIAYCLVAVGTA